MKRSDGLLSPGDIEARLIEAGIRPTAQRIAVGSVVLRDGGHPSADEVKARVDLAFPVPRMSLATVYNTLKAFVAAGLLKEIRLPRSEKILYDYWRSEHFHFLDEATGELVDIPAESVEVTPSLAKKYKIRSIDVLLRGTRT
jgi:Fur family iron response transcriptional regulator